MPFFSSATCNRRNISKGPAARFLFTLVCLWTLTGSQPLLAHEVGDEETVADGSYNNPTENRDGLYILRRIGPTVFASMATARSPVQYLARQAPSVLFTIPPGFRPAQRTVWEVEAKQVLLDGTVDPERPGPIIIRMRFDQDGAVGYVNDSGVDGVGFLQYASKLTWIVAGAQPRVCERTPEIQAYILAALRELGQKRQYCQFVTWQDLGKIRNFHVLAANGETAAPLLVARVSDLAGLTGLQQANLSFANGLPIADLLGIFPQLTSLTLNGSNLPLSADLLAQTPHLSALTLSGLNQTVPADLLAHVPQLTSLTLNGSYLQVPADLLAQTPKLTALSLSGGSLTVHANLLAHVPQLSSFSVNADQLQAPEGFLAHTPHLTALSLKGGYLVMPADLLAHIPNLSSLDLNADDLQVPGGWLADVPNLSTLSLRSNDLQVPADLLAYTPHLASLSLKGDSLQMPSNLLADVPNLTTLSLRSDDLQVPMGLLANNIRLTTLSLSGNDLNLPVDLLAYSPQLASLSLSGSSLKAPADLLAHSPLLISLSLQAGAMSLPGNVLSFTPLLTSLNLSGLSWWDSEWPPSVPGTSFHPAMLSVSTHGLWIPEDFLQHTPRLTKLSLRSAPFVHFPLDLLEHTPRLTSLSLLAQRSIQFHKFFSPSHSFSHSSLYPKMLAHTPELTSLELGVSSMEIQGSFLVHVPKLKRLILNSWGDAWGVMGNTTTHQYPLPPDFLDYTPQLTQISLRKGRHYGSEDIFRSSIPSLQITYIEDLPE